MNQPSITLVYRRSNSTAVTETTAVVKLQVKENQNKRQVGGGSA